MGNIVRAPPKIRAALRQKLVSFGVIPENEFDFFSAIVMLRECPEFGPIPRERMASAEETRRQIEVDRRRALEDRTRAEEDKKRAEEAAYWIQEERRLFELQSK